MDETRRHAPPHRRHCSPRRCRWTATLAHQPLVTKLWLAAHSNCASNARVAQLTDRRYDLGGPSSGRNLTARSAPTQAPQRTEAPLRGDADPRTAQTEEVSSGVLERRSQRASSATYRSEIRSRRPEQWTKPDGTLRPLRRYRSARRRRCAATLAHQPLMTKAVGTGQQLPRRQWRRYSGPERPHPHA